MMPVEAPAAQALDALFAAHAFHWPPRSQVPAVALLQLPPDLAAQAPQARKQLFLRALLPLVLAENARIRRQRAFLQAAFARPALDESTRAQLQAIASYYRISGDLSDRQLRRHLLTRVDGVPVALALAQAAAESGWGTSRLAVRHNNLFGHFIPRADGSQRPARFKNLGTAVRAYAHNINAGPAYEALRQTRARLRSLGRTADSLQLAGRLERYSIRGADYIEEIRHLIRSNRLQALEALAVKPAKKH
jgi:Bax protein